MNHSSFTLLMGKAQSSSYHRNWGCSSRRWEFKVIQVSYSKGPIYEGEKQISAG